MYMCCANSLQPCLTCVTLWTVAHQTPLSVGFSRHEYWLPCPPLGHLPDPGIKPKSLVSLALADRFFPTTPPGKPCYLHDFGKFFNASVFQSAKWNINSSTLAWRIPWTEEPGGLQSMGLLRVRHDWATSLSLFTHWRRKWQPTPVFLPGESQGRGSLVGCRLWGRKESDTTEAT